MTTKQQLWNQRHPHRASQPQPEPEMTAVRLFGQVVPPRYEECPQCFTTLQYWKSGRGFTWVCPKCNRALREDQL